MENNERLPEMIVIAGPNGSGKTSVTQKFFISTSHPPINAARIANRVMKGGHDVPIPKIISRYYKSIENCHTVARLVNRLYVYDNSVDGEDAKLLFRLVDGTLKKRYATVLPEWALLLLDE